LNRLDAVKSFLWQHTPYEGPKPGSVVFIGSRCEERMGTTAYIPQADDYIAAAKLERRLQFRRNWASNLLIIVLLGGLGIATVLGVGSQDRAQGFGMLGIGVFTYALFSFHCYVAMPADIRRSFRRRAPRPVRIEWGETHLISRRRRDQGHRALA
jgi:hypothetical protein